MLEATWPWLGGRARDRRHSREVLTTVRRAGTNQEIAQARNRELVLKILQNEGRCTRVELSRQSGLKQGTITNIIGDFVSWGVVEETGALVGKKGRRSIGIRITDEPYRVIGLRITRQYFMVGVFALNGTLIGTEFRQDYEATDPLVVLGQACDTINRIIAEGGDCRYVALGVAVPGPYLRDVDEVAMINSFPGWRRVPVGRVIREKVMIPVIVDHDANAGVLAEWSLEADQAAHDSILYISVGQGVGAGILRGGAVFRGARGVAGEIGHTSVDINGPRCECGARGCLTLFASTLALTSSVGQAFGRDVPGSVPVAFDEVIELVHSGDARAVQAFDRAMRYLGTGVVNALFTYDPSLVIVGDEMSRIGQPVVDALNAVLAELTVERLRRGMEVRLSRLGTDSAFLGAGVLASHYVFSNLHLVSMGGYVAS